MSQTVSAQTLIDAFESWVPKELAVGGDREKIGLQVGSYNQPVKNVMVALDVLEHVVDEAIESNVDFIIAHHPLIFHSLQEIDTDTPTGKVITKCIKHDIGVYAAHTNLDVAPGGVNDLMADSLGLGNTEVLVPTSSLKLNKLVVFVPKQAEGAVRAALGEAGAGYIGNYSHCTFSVGGVGTFLPHDGTDPHIGRIGALEEVGEVRIETIVPEHLQMQVIRTMLSAHPYEEVAYDIYPLENQVKVLGLGRVGELTQPMTLEMFAGKVKEAFAVSNLRLVGDPKANVRKVAVLGGDGNKFISQALSKDADVFVTGDVYYHTAHDAWMQGLHMIDPGHNVEKIMKAGVCRFFEDLARQTGYAIHVMTSASSTEPFRFI